MIGREGHVKALYGKLGGRMGFPSDDKFNDPLLFRWEPVEALLLLAVQHPDVDFIVTSAHDGNVDGWMPNVFSAHEVFDTKKLIDVEPYLSQLIDTGVVEHIINWVGVNAVSQPVPKLDGSNPVKPLTSDQFNTAPLVRLINQWRDKSPLTKCETWLWPDARYHLKVRDLKWPITKPVVSQMDIDINLKLHRYGDPHGPDAYNYFHYGVKWAEGSRQTEHTDWIHAVPYRYAGLETLAAYRMPTCSAPRESRSGTVLIMNEIQRAQRRYDLANHLKSNMHDFPGLSIYGNWESEDFSKGMVRADQLNHTLAQFDAGILPTLMKGRSMATLKYWEYIRSGVIPVAAPGYDEQRHLDIPFRAKTYDDLKDAVWLAGLWSKTDEAVEWLICKNNELNSRAAQCLRTIMA